MFPAEVIVLIMRTVLIIALLTALPLSACGGDSGQSDEGLLVVVTTTILGDVVSHVVGDDAVVEVLVPTGASPHDYRASSQQVAAINRADLVVANGLGFEEGLEDVLESAAGDGARILTVGELVGPIPFAALASDHDHEASDDPHFWMDPLRVAEATLLISEELALVDDTFDWSDRAETYAEELASLDLEIISVLGVIPDDERKLVSNHHSLGYFAERYDFETIGVIIPGGSTLGDPSSEELADLVSVIEEEQVRAIFAETTEPSALAEAVAAEVGREVEVVDLYTGSLGEPGSGAETYIAMMQTNARLIVDALG
jgi:zinc/manganese transport system substrate-binding protein